jgi:hypothetical protein
MEKLHNSRSFTLIFEYNLLYFGFTDFHKAHIDKGLKEQLTLHFINPYRQFSLKTIFSHDDYLLILILNFFAFVFDFG